MDADEIDYEMAFERFAQAYLLGEEPEDLGRIRDISEALRSPSQDARLHIVRRRLRNAVGHFLQLANT